MAVSKYTSVHLIFDYTYLYYKYKFALETGRMRRLSTKVDVNGVVEERDVSQIYYSLREIEKARKDWETKADKVTVSVCFDMGSSRKDDDTEEAKKYKSNRAKTLNETDFENIQIVERMLSEANHNTYRFIKYEADDLIHILLDKYKSKFELNVIYTPDADVLMNICSNVSAMRYKSGKGYTNITVHNFEEVLSSEMKCSIPYNSLMLYKCTVGDKSDLVDGIKKFGPKAFDKLVDYLNAKNINWSICGTKDVVKQILDACTGYLSNEQIEQARGALDIVAPKPEEDIVVTYPDKVSTREYRENAYGKYEMFSLVD